MYKSLRAQTLHYFARPHEGLPIEPIRSPAAWHGEDLRDSPAWRIELQPAEIAELNAAVAHATALDRPLGCLTRHDFPLPLLRARIDDWRGELRGGRGFVLIRGVPVQDWSESGAEIFFWCFGQHLGLPGAQNPQNDLLGHVRDQRASGDMRYYRTNKAIAVHCDAADVVGLLCLRKAKSGGLSRIASSVAVFNELRRLRPDLAPRLFEPMYFDTKGEGGVDAFPIAPCRFSNGELRTFWQSDYYRTAERHAHVPRLTAAEHELLDVYDGIANDPRFHLDMDLEPGDVQLVSNHTILHARTAFEDFPEPERRRHLLRLWLSLPERRQLRERLRRARSLAGLLLTSTRELAAARKRA